MDWIRFVSHTWTLFLDRDGVINERLSDDYVKSATEFNFLPGALESIHFFNQIFNRIIIVSNQQGIGKGIMTSKQLDSVHQYMLSEIEKENGHIDTIFICPQLATEPDNYRKPAPTMAFMAKEMYPEIDFSKSIMVGDTESDILFGKKTGMKTVLIGNEQINLKADLNCNSLSEFAKILKNRG
ncbi:MAG: HAD-IIIA family hydrolase [Lentimicrobiaceae bacterium]|jgi:histidinol-phosphate phosphatase family protein|nr:HAD-IIIA family hydrolase [Lentimicrobiaceae bacterium]